eukprot:122734-Pyramimonas_sp.AAC.1
MRDTLAERHIATTRGCLGREGERAGVHANNDGIGRCCAEDNNRAENICVETQQLDISRRAR